MHDVIPPLAQKSIVEGADNLPDDRILEQSMPDFAFVVEGDADAITIYDSQWRFVYVNAATVQLTGFDRTQIIGRSVKEIWPRAFESDAFRPLKAAMRNRELTVAELPSASQEDMWREARAVPIKLSGGGGDGLLVYWRDITETRKLELARQKADASALAAARALDAVHDAFLTLDADFRITFANAEAGRINGKPPSSFVSRTLWDEWPTLIGSPVEEALRRVAASQVPEHFIRHWDVPGRHDIWLEVTAYPDELAGGVHLVYRDITARHKRRQREDLLAGLAERSQSAEDPEEIIADSVNTLGKFLGVSRCVYSDIDLAAGTSTVHDDYRLPGVSSIAGVWPISNFGSYLLTEYAAGRPVVVEDVRKESERLSAVEIAAYETIGAIARVTVPLVHSTRLVSAMAIYKLEPTQWAPEEIDLVRTVLERTWYSVEVSRQQIALKALQLRDHTIAEQLQRALLPEFPQQLNGLRCAAYYRAALEEAGVGGDFADCFSCDGGNTICLAVGDVSGKGLKAASQVAAVRNMLRFAVYANRNLADAVTQLNQALIDQQHLDGFATLFVATFDAKRRELTYVNCGQEPGLLWRAATREVEYLGTTGSVIGTIHGEKFDEAVVSLEPSDVLALFTDGLTEAGPTRKRLLGMEGVSNIFAATVDWVNSENSSSEFATADSVATAVTNRLIKEVEAHAGGAAALRDDVVVIVIVGEPEQPQT